MEALTLGRKIGGCIFTLAALFGGTVAHGQDIMVLRGATVHTAAGPPIENAVIVIRGDKIAAVGQNIAVPERAKIYDVRGKTIIPGMMDNHSHIGANSADLNDSPVTIGPENRFIDALNLDDPDWKEAVKGGVTTVVTGPGSGENVSGQAIVIKTFGTDVDKRIINLRGGLKFAMGAKSNERYPSTTMGVAANLRAYLIKTQEYMAAWKKWEDGGKKGDPPTRNLGYDAMAEVLNHKNRVRAHVHSATDVMTLLRLKDEFGFDLELHHSTEAYKVADEIAKRHVSAVVLPLGPRIGITEDAMRGPYILWKAGVLISMHTDHPVINEKWFRLCAALAMHYGLPEEEALKALTINPATAARVADRVGSIETGKDADLVVMNGPWYEPRTRVDMVFGNGALIYDRSKEDK
jgi:imidazolonepropionase-like amidohydrolase